MTAQQVSVLLHQALNPSALKVLDDAATHSGHSGTGHFRVSITSPAFRGKNRLQIHRMIYTVLEPYMENGIHALSIDAKID